MAGCSFLCDFVGVLPIRRTGVTILPLRRPSQPDEPLRRQYWRHAKPLLLDGFLFLTVLAILLVSQAGLRVLAAAGYDGESIGWLEKVHFIAYAAIMVLFAFDMVMKVLSIIFGGGR
jgi:hypothetical protein